MSAGTDRIRVIARIRPLNCKPCCLVDEEKTGISIATSLNTKSYRLDRILDGAADQHEVFKFVEPLIDDAIAGINTSLFTYGQTGSGKTHTMLGYDLWNVAQAQLQGGGVSPKLKGHSAHPTLSTDQETMGVIPRSMKRLFDIITARGGDFRVTVSYIEIYNEKLIDLLNSDEQALGENPRVIVLHTGGS